MYIKEGSYLSIGEAVELNVSVSCYNTKNGIRYSLIHQTMIEGEF
jgi:hypothetical protein